MQGGGRHATQYTRYTAPMAYPVYRLRAASDRVAAGLKETLFGRKP
jgi:hypothetical protein